MLSRWLEDLFDHEAKLPPGFVMPTTVAGFIWHFVNQMKLLLSIVICLVVAVSFAVLATPKLISELVRGFTSNDPLGIFMTWKFFQIATLAILVKAMIVVLYRKVFITAHDPYTANLVRIQLFQHMLGQSLGFFQSQKSGEIGSMVFQAGEEVKKIILLTLGSALNTALSITACVTVVFFVHWTLGLLAISWILLYVLLGIHFIPRQLEYAAKAMRLGARNSGEFVDVFANIATAKLCGRESDELDRAIRHIKEHTAANKVYEGTQCNMMMLIEVISTPYLLGLSVLVSLWLLVTQQVTGVGIVLVVTAIAQVLFVANWAMYQNIQILETIGKLRGMLKTLATPHGVVDVPNAAPLEVTAGEIKFQNVTVRYGKTVALSGINLTIRSGERVGIVGPSGSGKTTLLRALARSFDINGGTIFIDNQDVSQVSQNSLRHGIVSVDQDPSLLHRSVRENIAYANPKATTEEIIAAAQAAQAHSFIMKLPDGYETIVGERGLKLSGGQRQRITIARALLAQKRILILDEATSALDNELERATLDGMNLLFKERESCTVLAVAHRLSTLDAMDRIIVLENGRIVADSTHDELMAYDNFYSRNRTREDNGFLPAAAA